MMLNKPLDKHVHVDARLVLWTTVYKGTRVEATQWTYSKSIGLDETVLALTVKSLKENGIK